MALDDKPAGTVVDYKPVGTKHAVGHDWRDFKDATKLDDGSWRLRYDNGDTVISGGPAPTTPKPDANWTPNIGDAQNGDPWNILKGSDPPFPPPPPVPGGVDAPGKGVNVISVDAITRYARSIEALLPVVTGGIKELDGLASRGFGPGNFGAANNFKAKVFGAAGEQSGATLLASTRQVFVETETIIKEVAARCVEIAQKYKTADELTKLDADEFGRMVSGVQAKITSLPLGAAS